MLSFAVWRAQVFEAHIVLFLRGTLSGVDIQKPQMFFVADSPLDSFLVQNIFQHLDLTVEPSDLFALFLVDE